MNSEKSREAQVLANRDEAVSPAKSDSIVPIRSPTRREGVTVSARALSEFRLPSLYAWSMPFLLTLSFLDIGANQRSVSSEDLQGLLATAHVDEQFAQFHRDEDILLIFLILLTDQRLRSSYRRMRQKDQYE